jgi:hypothetical protein
MRSSRWLALAAVLVLAGCAQEPTAGDYRGVIPTVSNLAPGQTVVAEWSETGGFTTPGDILLRPPSLVVYVDGTAIASAERTLNLGTTDVYSLVQALRADLAGMPAKVEMGAGHGVADATDAVLRVRLADNTIQSVTAYALEPDLGYPDRLVAAKKRMTDLWHRVTDQGTPYTSARARVVADPTQSSDGQARAWPEGIPVPPAAADSWGTKVYLIEATDAGPVKAAWPVNRWSPAILPDGTAVNVGWRYLLPTE